MCKPFKNCQYQSGIVTPERQNKYKRYIANINKLVKHGKDEWEKEKIKEKKIKS